MGREKSDDENSPLWEISYLRSAGVAGGQLSHFDLFNYYTHRAHRLLLLSGGLSVGPPISASFTASDYVRFRTYRPVNFNDFDGVGARLSEGSIGIYSVSYLTIWDGPAYIIQKLAYVTFSGLGLGIPGLGSGNGVIKVHYGDGAPVGSPDYGLDMKMPPMEYDGVYTKRSTTTAKREPLRVIPLASDVLFDFDQALIKAAAAPDLKKAGGDIRSYRGRGKIVITGYTDSKGDHIKGYNQDLSLRRANAVKKWLIDNGYLKVTDKVETRGEGSAYPVEPNELPGGADNPKGRAKNRRVEIQIDTR
jgi:outer membrane protein OmpA-like peptidoglycan-associated protein